jgi:hypothetical protein
VKKSSELSRRHQVWVRGVFFMTGCKVFILLKRPSFIWTVHACSFSCESNLLSNKTGFDIHLVYKG